MVTFVKRYLKYILLAAVFAAALSAVGAFIVQDIAETEARQSSYTRTEFDYFIASPDKAQTESIAEDPSVGEVFPYYALSNAFSQGDDADEVFLLLSDKMESASIALFGEKLLVAGEFDEKGAMLDMLAAQKLGVSVGDALTFKIKGTTFTRQVSGLYLTSTYGVLTEGIVLVGLSEDIADVHAARAYSGAFLTVNSEEGVRDLLQDYVGEGNVALSYEEYVAIHCGTKPPYQSQEEYEQQCSQKYSEYRESILESALRGGGQAVSKEESFSLIEGGVRVAEKSIARTEWLSAISAIVLFILLNVIFVVSQRKDDLIRSGEGMKLSRMAGEYSLAIGVSAVAIAATTCAVLAIVSSATYYISVCMTAALFFVLPVLVAIPLLCAFVWLYLKGSFYSHAA